MLWVLHGLVQLINNRKEFGCFLMEHHMTGELFQYRNLDLDPGSDHDLDLRQKGRIVHMLILEKEKCMMLDMMPILLFFRMYVRQRYFKVRDLYVHFFLVKGNE